MTFFTNIHK